MEYKGYRIYIRTHRDNDTIIGTYWIKHIATKEEVERKVITYDIKLHLELVEKNLINVAKKSIDNTLRTADVIKALLSTNLEG